jgi:hypothetical protein
MFLRERCIVQLSVFFLTIRGRGWLQFIIRVFLHPEPEMEV